MTHGIFAVNMDIVVAHTPLTSRNLLGKVKVAAFLCAAAGGAAHLAALVKSDGAVRRRGCRRPLPEFAVYQVVMGVVTSVGNR